MLPAFTRRQVTSSQNRLFAALRFALLTQHETTPAQSDVHPVTSKSAIRLVLEPLAIALALALAVRVAINFYTVPTESMVPTLLPGDHIVATPYRFREPARGDVVVFRSVDGSTVLVKRIVGTPGDYLDSETGHLRVGGHTVAEPYVADATATGSIQPQIVPSDTYFVMGDNRANSTDSRTFGPLPRQLILGRVRLVVWSSRAAQRHGLSRIFKCVE